MQLLFLLALILISKNALAQAPIGPALTLPPPQILQPPPFSGSQEAYDYPCQLILNNQFYLNSGLGGGFPVSDAATEANTSAIASLNTSIEQNTNISAQVAYNKCLAEEEAHRRNIITGTLPAPIDNARDAGQESQVPMP